MSRVIWIRSEVFDHGVFNTSIRWTVPTVFNFLAILRQHVPSQTVTSEQWLQVATTHAKPALSEDDAKAYWQVFTVLQQSVVGDTGNALDHRTIGILLICQVFSPKWAKADQFSKSTEIWNERAVSGTSPRHSPRGSPKGSVNQQALGRGNDFTTALLSFAKYHIGYWLQIVSNSLFAEPTEIRAEDFDVLGLVFCAGTTKTQPLFKLSEALPDLVSAASLPPVEVRKAVQKLLVWNDDFYARDGAQPVQEPSAKTLNIMGVNKATWFHRPHNAEIEFLNIVDCKDSAFYVTARVRFCLISGCDGTNVILGGVSTLCTAFNCEKVSIHVAA
ncbi:unnamed protein product, partial [Polarella glacialis]